MAAAAIFSEEAEGSDKRSCVTGTGQSSITICRTGPRRRLDFDRDKVRFSVVINLAGANSN